MFSESKVILCYIYVYHLCNLCFNYYLKKKKEKKKKKKKVRFAIFTINYKLTISPITKTIIRSLFHAHMRVKLIDFGNAFDISNASLYYDDFNLQTLFYRAPEVLLGLPPLDYAIDMWSLG